MRIDPASEIDEMAGARLMEFRRRKNAQARMSALVSCAMMLSGCGCSQGWAVSQAASVKPPTPSKVASVKPPAPSKVAASKTPSRLAASVPLPPVVLLSPQPEPSCGFETAESKSDEWQKLDYERQCYRHAEMIARGRLEQLQGSVEKTIEAIKRNEGGEPASSQ
jgi:hypothetical protein